MVARTKDGLVIDEEALTTLDYIYQVTSDPHFQPELQFVQTDQRDLLIPQLEAGRDSRTVNRELIAGRQYRADQLEYLLEQLTDQGYVRLRRGPNTVHRVRITPDGRIAAEQRSKAS